MPDALFDAAERLANRLGISRSEVFQRAMAAFVREHRLDGVTEALDAVYPEAGDGGLDPALEQLQAASVPKDEW